MARVKTPSRYLSLEYLERVRAESHGIGAGGQEYAPDELDALIHEKHEARSENMLRAYLQSVTLDSNNGKNAGKNDTMSQKTDTPYLPETPIDASDLNVIRSLIKTEAAKEIHAAASDTVDILTAKVADEVAEKAKTGLMAALAFHKKQQDGMLELVRTELSGYKKPAPMSVILNNGPEIKLEQRPAACLKDLLIGAHLDIHSFIVGPAGCGKSTAAEQLAKVLGREFKHICFTSGASESWLFGRQTPNGFQPAPFIQAFENGGVFLGDEMDAADANMLMAINTALANGKLHNPISGKDHIKHPDFVFIGAANTVGKGADFVYTGRNRLDASTLDRFRIIFLDYNRDLERDLLPNTWACDKLHAARDVLLEKRSSEVISTRAFDRTNKLLGAGVSWEDIVRSLTAGWSPDLIQATKLLSEAMPAAESPAPEAKNEGEAKRGPGRPRGSQNKEKAQPALKGTGGFFSDAHLKEAYSESPEHLKNDAIPF